MGGTTPRALASKQEGADENDEHLYMVVPLSLTSSRASTHPHLLLAVIGTCNTHVHPALSRKSRSLPRLPSSHGITRLVLFCAQSRVLSESEGLRWQAGGTPDENDEKTRAAVMRQCRLSSVVVVKETRLAEVLSPQHFLRICVFVGVLYQYVLSCLEIVFRNRCQEGAPLPGLT